MSKQDRQGVRTAEDLERKYDLAGLKKAVKNSEIGINKTNKTLEQFVNSTAEQFLRLEDEMTVNLRIDSSRGTVFKNNQVATVLSVVIFRGSERITDMAALRKAMGNGAYLQWKWQRVDEEQFGIISADDKHIGNDGFAYTISADDVDTKVTFLCELIVDKEEKET